ncbi:hypothetical protein MKX01_026224, partial [Papaver californicum]
VVCDAYTPQREWIPRNKRHKAAQIFLNQKKIGTVLSRNVPCSKLNVKWPHGWSIGGFPSQAPYYCAAGAEKSFGIDISDAHNKACLYAGININDNNEEVMSSQCCCWK